MNPSTLETSARFLRAAASYWGVPPDQLILGGPSSTIGGIFTLRLTIALTPDDLAGIVKRMHTMEEKPSIEGLSIGYRAGMSVEQSAQFDAEGLIGTWREDDKAIRGVFKGQPGTGTLAKEGAMVEPVTREFLDRNKDNAYGQATEGVGGRKVVHVDVPGDEPVTGGELPAAVWVSVRDIGDQQMRMASDTRGRGADAEFLVQVNMLTIDQRAKYCRMVPVTGGELPTAVWVPSREVSDAQVRMASDSDVMGKGYLLQVDLLTPEQKLKYGVAS